MKPDDPNLWLNKQAVERLRTVLNDQFHSVVMTAVTNIRSHGDRIALALQQQDYAAIRSNAHSVVSSAGVFGLLQLVNAARVLEYQDADSPVSVWQTVCAEFERILTMSIKTLLVVADGDAA